MSSISRRQFLRHSAAAAGVALVAARPGLAAPTLKLTSGADIVTLGRTGIKTSLVGLGTGMNGVGRSSHQLRLGQAGFTRLVRHALDRGITYIDTADQYGTHIFVREALRGVDRSKLLIQTKIRAHHPEVAKADIDRFREELGMETLDVVLLHCMTTRTWPQDMRPVMDTLGEAKAKGRIRAMGVSCHGWDPLVASLDCDWIDIQLARINPFGASMDSTPEKVSGCLRTMRQGGRGVIGMKICSGGGNTGAADRLKSLGYVLGTGCVDCFAIGFESPQQIDEVMQQIETVLK